MSPDGKTVIFSQLKDGQADIWQAHLDAPGGRTEPLIATPFNESDGRLSPDGRQLAYVSDETGRYDVYVRGFPLGTDRIRVSTGGGSSLAWSADGSQIYFRSGDDIMAATVSMRGISSPVRVVSLPPGIRMFPAFEVSRDGNRFYFVRPQGDDQVSVMLNWQAGLPKKE